MADETYEKRISGLRKKIVIGTIAVLAAGAIYLGCKDNIDVKVQQGFYSAKTAVVELVTNDIGEMADDLMKKINTYPNAGKYSDQLGQLASSAIKTLDKKKRLDTLYEIIKKEDLESQVAIIERAYLSQDYGVRYEFLAKNSEDLKTDDKSKLAFDLSRMATQEWFSNVWHRIKGDSAYKKTDL